MILLSELNIYDCLSYFTPLMQIWAGICLLFFYQKILLSSPLYSQIKRLNNRIDEIHLKLCNQFQYIISKDNKPGHANIKWEVFLPRIKFMAVLSFFFCIFTFFILGLRKMEPGLSITCHSSFFLGLDLIIILSFLCCFFNIKYFDHYYICALFVIGIILLYSILFCFIHPLFLESAYLSSCIALIEKKWLTIPTLIACFFASFVVGIRICRDWRLVKKTNKRISNLDKITSQIFTTKIFYYDKNGQVKQFDSQKYLEIIIRREYNLLMETWYLENEKEDNGSYFSKNQINQLNDLIDEHLSAHFKKAVLKRRISHSRGRKKT